MAVKAKVQEARESKGNAAAEDAALRRQLMELLSGEGAHVPLADAAAGMPANLRGVRPTGAEHSAWEILEHIRIAQWDILEFCRNPKHKSPDWPSGYWPESAAPPDAKAWDKCVAEIERDTKGMKDLVMNAKTDLFAKVPGGSGQTFLREALVLADHNAYHTGELVLVRRLLGAWK